MHRLRANRLSVVRLFPTSTVNMIPTFITSTPILTSPSTSSLSSSSFLSPHFNRHRYSLCDSKTFTSNHRYINTTVTSIPATSCSSSPTSVTSDSASTPTTIPYGKRMTSVEIRESFIKFFESKNHNRLPSASLIPSDPTILLNIAGMVPFKPIFLGIESAPSNPRATTSQKCVRTNDIENVGVTKRHHTFFEMLGNFSFGDYFKKDAIQWAWELLTTVYQIPKERLAISVYKEDDEAYQIWTDMVGIDKDRIQRLGDEDNFWASGPTGPCGPCSEIYFDFNPASTSPIDLEDDDRFIELYNLVFMQYSRNENGELSQLENKNIDTGMGLERMAQILQRVNTNYETDLILPIMNSVASLTSFQSYNKANEKQQLSLKVIGDHLRSVAHLIADGVKPSNIGRGYIVRRLIRRIVRHGRLLGIEGEFAQHILPTVSNLAKEANLNDVHNNLKKIIDEITKEESRFLQTLITGEERLQQVLDNLNSDNQIINGEDAFELYDTFGFPLELTQEIAAEINVSVDVQGFEKCMEEQRNRARAARDSISFDMGSSSIITDATANLESTVFEGYYKTVVDSAKVMALIKGQGSEDSEIADVVSEGDRVRVLLNSSPFYAEGGGQVGDKGIIKGPNGELQVLDTQSDTNSSDGIETTSYVHICKVIQGNIKVGDTVYANVNEIERRRITAHHTATHLLQAALKIVLKDGDDVSQAGSLVDCDRLRFDFNYDQSLTTKEIEEIEKLINQWISSAQNTQVSFMSLDEAKQAGAVAMFGEKYNTENVRVVDVPGISMELCGGTHVGNTKDIGLFKITSESGPSAGVRRIDAVCGQAVMPYLSVRDKAVRELSMNLKAKPEEIVHRVDSLQEELKNVNKELEKLRASLAISQALDIARNQIEVIQNDYKFIVAEIGQKADSVISGESLKSATERVAQSIAGDNGVVLLAARNEEAGKISFAAAVGKKVVKEKGVQAGKFVGAIAKMCGGGGGGRPNFAQAGGKDISKLESALEEGKKILREALTKE